MSDVKKVLFVCLGNICRSPIAEAVFLHLIKERGIQDKWEADSAAIGGWHVGSLPDRRARQTLAKHSVDYDNTARQIHPDDFNDYDFIFGMDLNNIRALEDEAKAVKNAKSKVLLLGDFDPQGERIIRDPYYDDDSKGFEQCYQQCVRCCSSFLDQNQ